MSNNLLRPLLVVEFLIAIEVVFTFWSEVGGQYHLDLMYWPWKAGIAVLAASLVVGITAALARNGGTVTRRIWVMSSLLVATAVAAGVVTYYYHLHEPGDQEDDDDQPKVTKTAFYGHRPLPHGRVSEKPARSAS
jgi:hypothetical protein